MEMKALSENQIHERVAAAKFEAKLVCFIVVKTVANVLSLFPY